MELFNSTTVTNEECPSFILDGEMIAYDRATGNILPFQELSTRKRVDVNIKDIKVQVM